MDEFSIIGISRGNEYSPNHVDNDAAIFNKVADELDYWDAKWSFMRKRNLWLAEQRRM